MLNFFKRLFVISSIPVFSGCAVLAGYENSYTAIEKYTKAALERRALPYTTTEVSYAPGTSSIEEVIYNQFSEGYLVIGTSAFTSHNAYEFSAKNQAVKVTADRLVIFQPTVLDKSAFVMPMTTYNNSSSYSTFSGNVNGNRFSGNSFTNTLTPSTTYFQGIQTTYGYRAAYFIRVNPAMGALFKNLTPEETNRVGRNDGVRLVAVMRGSKMYNCNVLVNDVLFSINGKPFSENVISTLNLADPFSINLNRAGTVTTINC